MPYNAASKPGEVKNKVQYEWMNLRSQYECLHELHDSNMLFNKSSVPCIGKRDTNIILKTVKKQTAHGFQGVGVVQELLYELFVHCQGTLEICALGYYKRSASKVFISRTFLLQLSENWAFLSTARRERFSDWAYHWFQLRYNTEWSSRISRDWIQKSSHILPAVKGHMLLTMV